MRLSGRLRTFSNIHGTFSPVHQCTMQNGPALVNRSPSREETLLVAELQPSTAGARRTSWLPTGYSRYLDHRYRTLLRCPIKLLWKLGQRAVTRRAWNPDTHIKSGTNLSNWSSRAKPNRFSLPNASGVRTSIQTHQHAALQPMHALLPPTTRQCHTTQTPACPTSACPTQSAIIARPPSPICQHHHKLSIHSMPKHAINPCFC